MQLKNLSLA